MFVRTFLYSIFHTSSSDEIPTKNQLEGQFHTLAVSLVSNFDRVVKFCGTSSYLFFTPHRVMRFLQRISLKVSFTPAVSIKLLSSEEPTSYPIFHTLPSGEILTKSQLKGQFFTPYRVVRFLQRVNLKVNLFTPYRVVRFLQRVSLKVNLFTPYQVVRFLQRVSLKVNLFTPYRVVRFLQRVSLKVNLFTPYRVVRFLQRVSLK